jgi:hypothetical protein
LGGIAGDRYSAALSVQALTHAALGRALVATLLGLLMSNLGLIPCDAPQYSVVNKMLLPLAIPMLLFSADLRYRDSHSFTLTLEDSLRYTSKTAYHFSACYNMHLHASVDVSDQQDSVSSFTVPHVAKVKQLSLFL